MTERERIEKTYKEIRLKYPDTTSQEEITALAIKADKKNTLMQAIGWLAGGIACFAVFLLMLDSSYESVTAIFMIMAGSGLFEFFRTMGKYSKIEKRYRPVVTVHNEGVLTLERVLKNGGRKLKKADKRFVILKKPLLDKNDELDTGTDNDTHHTYTLHFDINGSSVQTLEVKRNVYLDAVLGVEYYLVATSDEQGNAAELVSAYQATNWTLSSDIIPYVEKGIEKEDNMKITQNSTTLPENVAVEVVDTGKKPKLLPITAIILAILGFFSPLIAAIPLNIAALVVAIIAIKKEKNRLTKTSVVVSGVSLILIVVVFVAAINGLL